MNRDSIIQRGVLFGAVALSVAYGCDRQNPYKLTGDPQAPGDCPPLSGAGPGATTGGSTGAGAGQPTATELDERVVDYGEALRTASLTLVGTLPTLQQVYDLRDTPEADRPDKYAEMVDAMLLDPRFKVRMIEYWQNVFKMYGPGIEAGHPSRDTAPVFAARIVVEDRPWTDLVAATSDTCPSYDEATGTFVGGECDNGVTPAGILTDPGVQSLYFGNMAFRRNRFFQELFLCRDGNAPGGAEPVSNPSPVGPCGEAPPANYTSPWPMDSISGECNGGRVDFHEWNTTTVCASCHATWNHRAPLFAHFDANGMYHDDYQTPVPVEGAPLAVRTDWLPDGEPTAWKFGMEAANLTELGQQMMADPDVPACAVKRIWNYAMSRGDIVENETPVPNAVIAVHAETFKANGFRVKAVLRDILLSDDFVSF